MDFHKNAKKREPKISTENSARLNYLSKEFENCATAVHSDSIKCLCGKETVFTYEKNGFISTLFLRFYSGADYDFSNIKINIFTDNNDIPNISQNINEFFMSGDKGKKVFADYMGKNTSKDESETTFYRHIFIPFRDGCRIELESGSDCDFAIEASIQYSKTDNVTDYGRFSNAYGASKIDKATTWGEEVVLLEIEGKGAFNSFCFSMKNELTKGTFMEGNIEIYVDNNDFPEYQSTGTEEFFMGGVYFMNLHTSAFSSCSRTFLDTSEGKRDLMDTSQGGDPEHNISAQRFFVDDVITFDRKLKIIWHNGQHMQGEVVGPTYYDFSCIYYTYGFNGYECGQLETGQAQLMLSHADKDKFDLPIESTFLEKDIDKGGNELLKITGEGRLELLYLSLGEEAPLNDLKIFLDIDGRKTDTIPLSWFFLCSEKNVCFQTENSGKTGNYTYYKYCDIQYEQYLCVYIENENETIIKSSVYAEFRKGKSPLMYEYNISLIEESKYPISDFKRPEILNAELGGQIEAITVYSDMYLGNSTIGILDNNSLPIVTEKLSSFMLLPNDYGDMLGSSANGGMLNSSDDAYFAYRTFNSTNFSFTNNISIYIRSDREGRSTDDQMKAVVFYKTIKNKSISKDEPLSVNEINRKTNINDFAYNSYEMCCYNPTEAMDGKINAGETAVIFEDFGPGCIKCLRCGTPPAGEAMHESIIKMYLNGETEPSINTTLGRFYSATYDDPLYWSNTKYLSRLSKKINQEHNNSKHSGAFRYINIPYSDGIKCTLTVPKEEKNSGSELWSGGLMGFNNIYYASSRNGLQDFGLFNNTKCISNETRIKAKSKTEIADVDHDGAITSIQLMIESAKENAYMDSTLCIEDGSGTPIVCAPLYAYFLGAPPAEKNPEIYDEYNEHWKKIIKDEEGYYSAPENGWIRRGNKRNVVYRLLDKRPILVSKGTKIYIKNVSDKEINICSDIITRFDRRK